MNHATHSKTAPSFTQSPARLESHDTNSLDPYARQLTPEYQNFLKAAQEFIPHSRLIYDPLRTLAFGTDASFYRLVPKIVIDVCNEEEVSRLLKIASSMNIPVTFRASGTSLSGQAITDSVLIRMIPSEWTRYKLHDNEAKVISMQPGIIGSVANHYLACYGRKIGPDPASINSAMIGGIVANNASGMCCGISMNSYHTLQEMRIIFADGTLLDTASEESRNSFRTSHSKLLSEVTRLSQAIKGDEELRLKVQHKYKIKNTTGYSLNALVDFDDPFEIIKHLVVGSEGTLGFIAGVTMKTVEDMPHKATTLILFPDVFTACNAAAILKEEPVDAVELMDRASLRSAEKNGIVPSTLGVSAASLLVDTRAKTKEELEKRMNRIIESLKSVEVLESIRFTTKPDEYSRLWSLRKGLLPIVGAERSIGTSVITEDVAVPIKSLANLVLDLQQLFKKYRYEDAIIFGHALEGNIHIIFSQSFNEKAEIDRYQHMMDGLCDLVAVKYKGSLKAEHGTGRNIAPYVELEWGKDAYRVMWDIKRAFDPKMILSPGVMLNEDPNVHLKNLKPMPKAHEIVDHCIECGFCESQCPSREITLTPRQRIVVWREMERLKHQGDTASAARLKTLQKDFEYQGNKTCAADGMCATTCPVSINTGTLIKAHRASLMNEVGPAKAVAGFVADNFSGTMKAASVGLTGAHIARSLLGDKFLGVASNVINQIGRKLNLEIPTWNPYIPKAAEMPKNTSSQSDLQVIYFPTCVSRLMGPAAGDSQQQSLPAKVNSLLQKANIGVSCPKGVDGLCCGLAFESKGFHEASEKKTKETEEALWKASDGGKIPILCDTSPCTSHMKKKFANPVFAKQIMEPINFSDKYLMDRLDFSKKLDKIVIHTPCSSKQAGLDKIFLKVAHQCCDGVSDSSVPCCGMAGDRGLAFPELTASATKPLRTIPPFKDGYSTSRTCEIGLSLHSGVHFRNIFYLIDEVTTPKKT
eukprot:TRINITY_DN8699_c1_g1_i1.p1 TRINITY_DN8699_c1_g1~~TRINITY_DN8699_c1_g1_i1.p1  ORF type:complete len:1011 (+),score=234.55 TRINITY_DN8699_c1_g1_i1:93-3035(+)